MASEPKVATVERRLLLAPKLLRGYSLYFMGCVIGGYTLLIAGGAWIFTVASCINMILTLRLFRRRTRFPRSAATTDATTLVGGAFIGTLFVFAYLVVVDGMSAATLLRAVTAGPIALLAFTAVLVFGEGRSWRRPFRPVPPPFRPEDSQTTSEPPQPNRSANSGW